MTLPWRTLEREIVELLRGHGFEIRWQGDTFVKLDYDLPMTFNLTIFARELAERLERT